MNKSVEFTKKLALENKDFVVAHVVETQGSSPGKKGAWLVMARDGQWAGTVGGGSLEAEAQRIARESFDLQEPFVKEFNLTSEQVAGLDMRCGGNLFIHFKYYSSEEGLAFIETLGTNYPVYVFGCGHIGRSLEPLLRFLDFDTIMLDDRAEYASKEHFPQASDVIVIEDYDKAFEKIKPEGNSFIVIVTRGHFGDYQVLRDALTKPHAYIGMIGSRTKIQEIYTRLMDADGVSQETLDHIHSPIGLKIGAVTPEEIAVSIASQLIAVRKNLEDSK
jgi:xanthine dehydrogenase accessory factor